MLELLSTAVLAAPAIAVLFAWRRPKRHVVYTLHVKPSGQAVAEDIRTTTQKLADQARFDKDGLPRKASA